MDNRAVAVEGSADLETAFGEVIDRSLERGTR
jgi:hypothetical protein